MFEGSTLKGQQKWIIQSRQFGSLWSWAGDDVSLSPLGISREDFDELSERSCIAWYQVATHEPTASARLNRVGAIFRPQQLDDFHIHRISSYIDISWSNYSHTTSSWWNILARYIDLEIELTPERKLAQVVIKSCAQRSLSDLQF